ncbi:MAG: PKD domain-containing protein [Chitinophagaceae bacterium]|nr:MAG: PKD domain-containing protein [Chitinophagaceae bacterium]
MIIKRLQLLVACLLSLCAVFGQGCPPNIDFELGTLDGWDFFTGSTSVDSNKNVISLSPSAPQPGRHELINTSSIGVKDKYGNFPILCPYGGTTSVKLGNDQTQHEAEGLSYTFTVPNLVDTFSFTYYYAVVFQDPNHIEVAQPRFFVTAYDVESGELINCASYDYIATGGIPGFKKSTFQSDVLYKEWSPVSIQFAGLANRKVRLEFKTADCTLGGHFGYAYVDVGSGCSNILATAPYCIESNSIILNAPYGFKTYTWYNEDYSQIIGNDQSLTLSPPPATTGSFHVDIVPYPGYGCRDTATAYVLPRPIPRPPDPEPLIVFCQNQLAEDFKSRPDPGNDLVWYSHQTGGTGQFNYPVILTGAPLDTTFWVSQKELFGCESERNPVTVRVQRSPSASFNINDQLQCLVNNKFTFTSTSDNLFNSHYLWDFGDGVKDSLTGSVVTHQFSVHGNYTVKLTVMNDRTCMMETPGFVSVGAKPLASFVSPPVICENQASIQLADNSAVPGGGASLSSWWWEIDRKIYNTRTPAAFSTTVQGNLAVRLAVKTSVGCESDTILRILPVRFRPIADFNYSSPLCNNEAVQFTDLSRMPATSPDRVAGWHWQLDNGSTINNMNPAMQISSGLHHLKLVAESNMGCSSEVKDTSFFVHPKPLIALTISDSCVRTLVNFKAAAQLQNVTKWLWNFGNGAYYAGDKHTRTYASEINFPLTLIGQTAEGCKDTVVRQFRIFRNHARAGNDTIVAKNEPVHLDAKGGTGINYHWSPVTGLNDASIENPVATLDKDQLYKLYSISEQGCEAYSEIFIKRYAGPELYIPNAFTPDSDGKNDFLKVFPVGIRNFGYLAIYSRNGQLLYRSSDYTKGWNGVFNGKKMDAGTYVAVAQAQDYRGKAMIKKTTVILLR